MNDVGGVYRHWHAVVAPMGLRGVGVHPHQSSQRLIEPASETAHGRRCQSMARCMRRVGGARRGLRW